MTNRLLSGERGVGREMAVQRSPAAPIMSESPVLCENICWDVVLWDEPRPRDRLSQAVERWLTKRLPEGPVR